MNLVTFFSLFVNIVFFPDLKSNLKNFITLKITCITLKLYPYSCFKTISSTRKIIKKQMHFTCPLSNYRFDLL